MSCDTFEQREIKFFENKIIPLFSGLSIYHQMTSSLFFSNETDIVDKFAYVHVLEPSMSMTYLNEFAT